MISHTKKFIFVHIPKTAGTSVSSVLSKYGKYLQGPANFDSMYFKHADAKALKRMLGTEFDNYFKFTFVRNPWDWIVSNFEYNRGLHRPFVKGTAYDVSPNIPDWAKDMSFQKWLPWWIENFHPSQTSMLMDENGRLLVQEIYRFENLSTDLGILFKYLNIWVYPKIPHLESSNRKLHYKNYYNKSLAELVRCHFSNDFMTLNYSDEL
jgi:hypothetical protein